MVHHFNHQFHANLEDASIKPPSTIQLCRTAGWPGHLHWTSWETGLQLGVPWWLQKHGKTHGYPWPWTVWTINGPLALINPWSGSWLYLENFAATTMPSSFCCYSWLHLGVPYARPPSWADTQLLVRNVEELWTEPEARFQRCTRVFSDHLHMLVSMLVSLLAAHYYNAQEHFQT